MQQHGRDESYHAVAAPDAVAFVQTTEEVSKVVKICAAARTPVIAFGAGSSLEGHISATYGGVSIDMTGMNKVINVSKKASVFASVCYMCVLTCVCCCGAGGT